LANAASVKTNKANKKRSDLTMEEPFYSGLARHYGRTRAGVKSSFADFRKMGIPLSGLPDYSKRIAEKRKSPDRSPGIEGKRCG
jgi:hypothetical protein